MITHRSPLRPLAALLLGLALIGCPKELPKDLQPDELWRIGYAAYEERDYSEAIEALQRMLFQDPGHPKSDSAAYLVADAYYEQGQHLVAASEFLRLAQTRPAGPLADDSRYRACQAYVELSPRPELDQEYTGEAIEQCRSVVLLYPQSPYAAQAADRVQELRGKLARKEYLTAEYYFDRNAFDSAIIYLEHLLENYPGTSVEPRAMLKLYQSYRNLGYEQEAQEMRESLLQAYPDTPEAAELRQMTSDDGEV